ncbi:hypothetical protein ACQP2F_14300 [Actinoplanes sp. CA-030573]|uniref:hypothetical protein n=1 Tax=Actinoplanes sp. CA-030573 TaxID=3239898 RepID=UPI003D92E3EF
MAALTHLGTNLYLCGRCTKAVTMICTYRGSQARGDQRRVYRCPECYLTRAADPIDHYVSRFGFMNSRIGHIFATSSGFLEPLVGGALNGIDGILGGVDSLVTKGRTVIVAFGHSFDILGHSVGDAHDTISGGSGNAASALENTARVMGALIEATGILVRGLTDLYGWISFVPGKISDVSTSFGELIGVHQSHKVAAGGVADEAARSAVKIAENGKAA